MKIPGDTPSQTLMPILAVLRGLIFNPHAAPVFRPESWVCDGCQHRNCITMIGRELAKIACTYGMGSLDFWSKQGYKCNTPGCNRKFTNFSPSILKQLKCPPAPQRGSPMLIINIGEQGVESLHARRVKVVTGTLNKVTWLNLKLSDNSSAGS